MKKTIVYELKALYRDAMRVTGYEFGEGEKAVCIVGSMRGNEVQQLYICGQLIKRLEELENQGKLVAGKKILVIPCLNSYSMNIGKRFWPTDNTDINRMFPGYDLGETTQRIAAGVFEAIKDFTYGIQFASFYMPGFFLPHVRIMKTGYEDLLVAKKFDFPYVTLRAPRPFDTATLNYNWQIWEAKAYSLYTTTTDQIDTVSAAHAIHGILNMMAEEGIITEYNEPKKCNTRIVEDDNMTTVRCKEAGLCFFDTKVGDEVTKGQLIATLIDPYNGDIIEKLYAPVSGIVFFQHNTPMTLARTAVMKLVH